jgi:hypothetical protein
VIDVVGSEEPRPPAIHGEDPARDVSSVVDEQAISNFLDVT